MTRGLALRRESLSELTHDELSSVAGAQASIVCGGSVPTFDGCFTGQWPTFDRCVQ